MEQKKCFHCYKSTALCICHYISKSSCHQKIIILQHPKEKFHPYNTAIIAKLSLPNCIILEGEDFTHCPILNERLKEERCILLFPDFNNQEKNIDLSLKDKTLILIDANWKKAKKIYFLSKNIQALPKLSLKPERKSIYNIRKSHIRGSLSTIESICLALEINHNGNYDSLLNPLYKMIEFTNNYKGDIDENT